MDEHVPAQPGADTPEFPRPDDADSAVDRTEQAQEEVQERAQELAEERQEHQERTEGESGEGEKYDGGEIPRNGGESAQQEPAPDSAPLVVEEPPTAPPVE